MQLRVVFAVSIIAVWPGTTNKFTPNQMLSLETKFVLEKHFGSITDCQTWSQMELHLWLPSHRKHSRCGALYIMSSGSGSIVYASEGTQ